MLEQTAARGRAQLGGIAVLALAGAFAAESGCQSQHRTFGSPEDAGEGGSSQAPADTPAAGVKDTGGAPGSSGTMQPGGPSPGGMSGGGTPGTGGSTASGMSGGGTPGTGGSTASGMSDGGTPGAGGTTASGMSGGGTPGTGGATASGMSGRGGSSGALFIGGAGGTTECSPGAHTCNENALLTCDGNGRWPTQGVACANVCRGDACGGDCRPGRYSCTGKTLLTCSAQGSWPLSGTDCAAGYTCDATAGACACKLTKCADDRCIDTTADPMNCGACGATCPGTCKASTCQCATPSAANLVAGSGFDSGTLSGWTIPDAAIAVSRVSLDSSACSSSGSVLLKDTKPTTSAYAFGMVSACIPVTAGTSYNLGAWVYLPRQTPQPGAVLQVVWYTETSCTYGSPSLSSEVLDASGPYDQWESVHRENVAVPLGAAAMHVGLAVLRAPTGAGTLEQAYFDAVYFTPSPGRF